MTLVHSICKYPGRDADWNSFHTRFLIKAIKGKSISDNWTVNFKLGKQSVQFGKNNAGDLTDHSARWMANNISSKHNSPIIIPIPNSDTTEKSSSFRMKEYAENIAQHITGSTVLPNLRFGEQRAPSSRGGGRVYQSLKDNYVWMGNQIPTNAILLDDVHTTGNHLKAAFHFLRERGCNVDACFVVARTCWQLGEGTAIALESEPLFGS